MEKAEDSDAQSETGNKKQACEVSDTGDEKKPSEPEKQEYESFSSTLDRAQLDKETSASDHVELDDEEEFKLPELDWESLEAKLKIAQQEVNLQNKRANLINDREEVRRKLAMVNSSSSSSSSILNSSNNTETTTNGLVDHTAANNPLIMDYLRKPSLSKHHLLGQNLQICFMNELNSDDYTTSSNDTGLNQEAGVNNESEQQRAAATANNNEFSKMPNSLPSFSNLSLNSSENSYDNILAHLQSETKIALSKVPSEVKEKIQKEKTVSKKPSPIADIVGLPTYGLKRLERDQIVDMNIGQLQVIVNDLCNQIENINEELKKMLIDRDDLYMQQDSLLVDIEDLTRRIQEYMLRYKGESSLMTMSYQDLTNSHNETATKIMHRSSNFEKQNSPKRQPSRNISNNNDEKDLNENSSKLKASFQLSNLTNRLYRFTKKT